MLLGLDLGTTNVKALLVEPGGRIVARASVPVGLTHVGQLGREQDIEEIFAATLAAIRAAGERGDLSSVRAVGVSAQGGALQLLDGQDRPVGRVISWLDGRGREHDERIAREFTPPGLARRTGHPHGTMALGQLLRIRNESPHLLAPPGRVGLVGDVIVGRLCGRRAHDGTSLSCAVLYNPSLDRADPDVLVRVGISEDQLPALLPPRTPASGLLESVAGGTGLPAGVPVSPAVHDQYASALGVGAKAGEVMFGTGTAWVLLALSRELTKPVANAGFCCRHVVEGLFGQILSMGNGGSAVTWALGLTGQEALAGDQMDARLRSVPAGADGLRFRPLLAPTGGAGLAAGLTGRVDGLRLAHGKAHLLRAVVEGLAAELARHLRLLEAAGVRCRRLIMCGGAAGSAVTPQIVADATGLPVACATEPDTSAVGAAMLARGLLEPRRTLSDVAEEMAPPFKTVAPGPDRGLYLRMVEDYLSGLAGEAQERPK